MQQDVQYEVTKLQREGNVAVKESRGLKLSEIFLETVFYAVFSNHRIKSYYCAVDLWLLPDMWWCYCLKQAREAFLEINFIFCSYKNAKSSLKQ